VFLQPLHVLPHAPCLAHAAGAWPGAMAGAQHGWLHVQVLLLLLLLQPQHMGVAAGPKTCHQSSGPKTVRHARVLCNHLKTLICVFQLIH
jgi:uncharacterized membrane protein